MYKSRHESQLKAGEPGRQQTDRTHRHGHAGGIKT